MSTISKTQARRIGDKLGISWSEIDVHEFFIGINIEYEHGSRYTETDITNDDPLLTGKIAWAHLKEIPDYYTRLVAMETEARNYWKDLQQLSESIFSDTVNDDSEVLA